MKEMLLVSFNQNHCNILQKKNSWENFLQKNTIQVKLKKKTSNDAYKINPKWILIVQVKAETMNYIDKSSWFL